MKKLTKADKKRLAKQCYMSIVNLSGSLEAHLESDIRIHGVSNISIEVDGEWFFFDDLFAKKPLPIITNDEWVGKDLNKRS